MRNTIIFALTFLLHSTAAQAAAPNASCEVGTWEPTQFETSLERTITPCVFTSGRHGSFEITLNDAHDIAWGPSKTFYVDMSWPDFGFVRAEGSADDTDGYIFPLGDVARSELDPACWIGRDIYICADGPNDAHPNGRNFPTPPLAGKTFASNCRMEACHWVNQGQSTIIGGPAEFTDGQFIEIPVSHAFSHYAVTRFTPGFLDHAPIDATWGEVEINRYFCSFSQPAFQDSDGSWYPFDLTFSGPSHSLSVSYANACHDIPAYVDPQRHLSGLGYIFPY